MADSDETKLFDRLQPLGVLKSTALAYRELYGDHKLYKSIVDNLSEHKITLSRLGTPLDNDILYAVHAAVHRAIMDGAEEGRSPKNTIIPAVSTLGAIRDLSNHILCSAQSENMQERWTKEYHDGYYAYKRPQIEAALKEGRTALSTGQRGYNNEGGASYYVCCARTLVYM